MPDLILKMLLTVKYLHSHRQIYEFALEPGVGAPLAFGAGGKLLVNLLSGRNEFLCFSFVGGFDLFVLFKILF